MSLRVWGPYSDPTAPVTHLELCTTPWKSESPGWALSSAGTNVHMPGAYERQKDCLGRQANWECDPLSRTGLFPVDRNMFGSFLSVFLLSFLFLTSTQEITTYTDISLEFAITLQCS